MRTDRLLLGALLALFVGSVQAALYKWVDDKGRVQYSDKPPVDAGKGGVEMSNRGIIRKKLETGLTPDEQKAKEAEAVRRRAEEQEAAAQRRADNALLQSFTSAEEVDMKRDREMQAIDAMISNLKGQERSLVERRNDERRRAERYAKQGKPLPDALKADLARTEGEVKVVREEIERRYKEADATKAKYANLRKRYLELRQPQGSVVPTANDATSSSVPGSAKK